MIRFNLFAFFVVFLMASTSTSAAISSTDIVKADSKAQVVSSVSSTDTLAAISNADIVKTESETKNSNATSQAVEANNPDCILAANDDYSARCPSCCTNKCSDCSGCTAD